MVVRTGEPELPLVDHSAAALSLHAVLSGQMFGEQPVQLWAISKQRKTSGIALSDNQPRLYE